MATWKVRFVVISIFFAKQSSTAAPPANVVIKDCANSKEDISPFIAYVAKTSVPNSVAKPKPAPTR